MPKQLLLPLAGLVAASIVAVAAILAFILPTQLFEPTPSELAEQQAQQETADGEGGDDPEGAADEAGEGTGQQLEEGAGESASEDAPGSGQGDEGSPAEPAGEDTGEIQQEQQDEG